MNATLEPDLLSASHKAGYDIGGRDAATTGRSVVLLVSVGADYHEGEKLGATIDLINRSGFSRCAIAVADTLQRHNLPDATAADRHAHAYRQGSQWIDRNRDYLDRIDCPTNILRWDYALRHPRYEHWYRQVEQAYHDDREYHDAIESTIGRFIDRMSSRGIDFDEAAARAACRAYLLEECPIIMPLWAEEGFDFIVYPQRITAAMNRTRELFVVQQNPDRAQWLALRFKKRKSARSGGGIND